MTVRTSAGPRDGLQVEPLTGVAAEEWLHQTCFRPGPAGAVGLELEVQPVDAGNAAAPLGRARLAALARHLAGAARHGRASLEPGGQVELSLDPQPGLVEALAAGAEELAAARAVAGAAGIRPLGAGVWPLGARRRVLDSPRYVAMESYLDGAGPAGRVMMTSTASVQVNVEASVTGEGAGSGSRWWLLHLVGPAMVAAFAHSPLRGGRPTGWKSTRQAVWSSIDPARTSPVAAGADGDPRADYARYALAAPVMMVRRSDGPWRVPAGLTFWDWIAGHGRQQGLGVPTLDDLAYHLTTLFPPVRPRGFLEVRYLDAQPARCWRVTAAVVWALVEDGRAGDRAAEACEPVAGRWAAAARTGTADPGLRRAALGCLAAARDALSGRGMTGPAAEVDAFAARYTDRGRCPGDDLLDALPAEGGAVPSLSLDYLEVLP